MTTSKKRLQHCYDRKGNPILYPETWCKLFEDKGYQRVAYTDLPGNSRVSTVWLGLDRNLFYDGPPIIFESMVFGPDREELACRRYHTEEQALQGHDELVKQWTIEGQRHG